MGLLKKLLSKLKETRFKYLFSHSNVRISSDSMVEIGHNVSINNSQIYICNKSKLIIADGTKINNAIIYCNNGSIFFGKQNVISGISNSNKLNITIDSGHLSCAHRVKLALSRLWIRFGGQCQIGEYTNINHDTEIRADESITIGSYCQISYNIKIWDTNTHNILSPEKRKDIAMKYWPFYGFEESRPTTKPIIIGDLCWIGERSSIFKGTKLGNNVIVGYDTLISDKVIPNDAKVVTEKQLRII